MAHDGWDSVTLALDWGHLTSVSLEVILEGVLEGVQQDSVEVGVGLVCHPIPLVFYLPVCGVPRPKAQSL